MSRQPPSPVSPLATSPTTVMPELNAAVAHLREILGDQSYESLVRKGEGMSTAAILAYAYDQIDQARTG